MDIEQRIAKLEANMKRLLEYVADAATTENDPDSEPAQTGELYTAVESERLRVRHLMAKSIAEIVENVGVTIEDLSSLGGIDKRTWKDLMLCAGSEYDYEGLAATRLSPSDDKYRSGISHLATSMKGVFVLREALRSLPMLGFSQEEFSKRKQADEACEKLLEGHDGKCEGWSSSFRTAKLFAQQQGYWGA
jgi:hypothetical protein